MLMPKPILVLIYFALVFSLALIVRRSYRRSRNGPGPKEADLERQTRFPYSPPPERHKRAFDRTAVS